MEKDKDYLDKLYSNKFSKFESNISADDWTKLSTKLGKTNFLKFSFTTFNAYFLGVIVSLASAGAYLGVNNVSLLKKNEKLEDKIEVLKEQQIKNDIDPLVVDTFIIEEPEVDENTEVNDIIFETKPIKRIEEKAEQLPDQLKVDLVNTKKDSLVLVKPDTSIVKHKKVIRRIKKKVFVKQDKVIIKDTVKVRRIE